MIPRQPDPSSDEAASDTGKPAAGRDPQSDTKHALPAQETVRAANPTEEEDRVATYLRGPTAFTA